MLSHLQNAEEDQRLMLLLKKGNQQALGLLYDQYAPALLGIIVRITNNRELAEKILHTVFVKAWNGKDSYNGSGISLFTWLISIARQSAFEAMKTDAEKNLSGSYPVYEAPENVIPGNAAFNLVYYKGFSFSDAATALHLPVSEVTNNIRMTIQNRQEKKQAHDK